MLSQRGFFVLSRFSCRWSALYWSAHSFIPVVCAEGKRVWPLSCLTLQCCKMELTARGRWRDRAVEHTLRNWLSFRRMWWFFLPFLNSRLCSLAYTRTPMCAHKHWCSLHVCLLIVSFRLFVTYSCESFPNTPTHTHTHAHASSAWIGLTRGDMAPGGSN